MVCKGLRFRSWGSTYDGTKSVCLQPFLFRKREREENPRMFRVRRVVQAFHAETEAPNSCLDASKDFGVRVHGFGLF